MSQEISEAGTQLRSAVDRYALSSFSVRDACLGGGRINDTRDLPALTSLVEQENNIESCIHTLEEARTALQLARSILPSVGCGNKLPVEILTHIFDLIPPDGLCLVQRDSKRQISDIKYSSYPDSLAHVCSYWRRVAIAYPSLWTHIDIALDHSLSPGLFDRAKTYATRARYLPLEIHISDPGSERERNRGLAIKNDSLVQGDLLYDPSYDWPDLHDFEIFTSDDVAIKSLELDLKVDHRHRKVYYSVLEYFLAHREPGLLVQYIVRCAGDQSVHPHPSITPSGTPHSSDSELAVVSSKYLEELWLRIPVIRVNGLCPYWTSKAYHGLVELYIDSGIPVISEAQLINILNSSPKLQVFHLKTPIVEDTTSIGTVFLEDLRDLNLMVPEDDGNSDLAILAWIKPGKRPLQLSLFGPLRGEASDFFRKANVSRFYVIYWEPCRFANVFKESSRFDTLVLNAYGFDVQDLSSLLLPGYHSTIESSQIDTLYLLWFTRFSCEEIKAVVTKYSVQKLLVYGGKLSYQVGKRKVTCKNAKSIKTKLSGITTCPVIEYYADANLIHQHCDDWIATRF